MKLNRRAFVAMGLATVLLFTAGFRACDPQKIERAISFIDGVPGLVVGFHLSPSVEKKILDGIKKGREGLVTFKDNPTRGNLRNAIDVLNKLVADGTFNTGNPNFDRLLAPAIASVTFVLNFIKPLPDPVVAGLVAPDDSNVPVDISEEQEKEIDKELAKAEKALKEAKDSLKK